MFMFAFTFIINCMRIIVNNLLYVFIGFEIMPNATAAVATIKVTTAATVKKQPYETLYPINRTIKDKEITLSVNSLIMEYTPIGNVIMFYNAKKSQFEYYSDREISIPYLHTVARKFVKQFKCNYLYIDDSNVKEVDSSSSGTSSSGEYLIRNTEQKQKKKINNFDQSVFIQTKKKTNHCMLSKNMNTFVKLGNINKFIMLKPQPIVNDAATAATVTKQMSYADYKRLKEPIDSYDGEII